MSAARSRSSRSRNTRRGPLRRAGRRLACWLRSLLRRGARNGVRTVGRRLGVPASWGVGGVIVVAIVLGVLSGYVPIPGYTVEKGAIPEGRSVTMPLQEMVEALPVAPEQRLGYDRALFPHWTDADANCRDTRDEVLRAESQARVARGCDVRRGEWHSPYDGAVHHDAAELDIDHMVPLAEAWDSGADEWDESSRQAFANDLGDARSLVAVTASANRSKSDQDPAEWMPALDACGYAADWTAVKVRWGLSADRAEKKALRRVVANCPPTQVKVRKALTGSARVAVEKAREGFRKRGKAAWRGADAVSCAAIKAAGFGPFVEGVDIEYRFFEDTDNDGRVCE